MANPLGDTFYYDDLQNLLMNAAKGLEGDLINDPTGIPDPRYEVAEYTGEFDTVEAIKESLQRLFRPTAFINIGTETAVEPDSTGKMTQDEITVEVFCANSDPRNMYEQRRNCIALARHMRNLLQGLQIEGVSYMTSGTLAFRGHVVVVQAPDLCVYLIRFAVVAAVAVDQPI